MDAQPMQKQPLESSDEDLENLSMADIEAAMKMSENDAVFTSVLSNYPVGAHIQCRCQVSDPADLSADCWVGLFKVGWASAEADCICRAECRRESDRVLVAVFSPSQLPRDTREFYQFCFAAPGGLVKGASPPFLFRAAPNDDFVAVLDEELQGVVVSARCDSTAQLESQLATMRLEQESQRSAAEDAAEQLRAELAELSDRLSATESRAADAESESGRLRAELGRQEEWRQVQAARLIGAEEEKQRLLRRLEEAMRDAQAAGDQADATRQTLELHSTERQRLAEELQAARQEAEQLAGQLQMVSGELEVAQQRERQVSGELSETQAAAEAAQAAAASEREAQQLQHQQELQQVQAELQQQGQRHLDEQQKLQQQVKLAEAQAAQQLAELQQQRQHQQAVPAELQALQARYSSLLTAYEGVKQQFHSAEDRERLMKVKYDEVIDCNKQMLAREDRLHQSLAEFQERLKQGGIEYKRLLKKFKDGQQLLHQLQRQQQVAPVTSDTVEEFHDAIGGDEDEGAVIHRPPTVDEESALPPPMTPLTAAAPVDVQVCPMCGAAGFAGQQEYQEHVHSHFGEDDN